MIWNVYLYYMRKIKVPSVFKNFYFNVTLVFILWMLFFDSNSIINQYRLKSKQTELIQQKEFYKRSIQEVEKDREELLTNPESLEKYAREKYFMKKPTEDVYILVEEND